MNSRENILEMKNIRKEFPGVVALDNINFSVRHSEVHCLVGENGAGKSTLMKILVGVYKQDKGEIFLDGKKVSIDTPLDAIDNKIGVVHQERNIMPELSIAENIYMGRFPKKNGFIDWKKLYNDTSLLLERIGYKLDPAEKAKNLSVSEQQIVEISKALSLNIKILILDEPTASFTPSEIKKLFDVMTSLKEQGVSIIFITHRLEEIFEIGDRATVLKDGKYVGTVELDQVKQSDIISMMVGRELGKGYPERTRVAGEEALRVEGLKYEKSKSEISFLVKSGEILGIAGLMGSGRTELLRAIFGADPIEGGEIYLFGEKVNISSPKDAVELGIGFVTEDRRNLGLIKEMSVKENITLPDIMNFCSTFLIDSKKEQKAVQKYIESLKIVTPHANQLVKYLSGGNQQKTILAKWLNKGCKVIFFDEPTIGIDVGAKEEIYHLMSDLAKQGTAIIMVSSELPEVLGMSDRLLVMREGSIVAELDNVDGKVTEEQIMKHAIGG